MQPWGVFLLVIGVAGTIFLIAFLLKSLGDKREKEALDKSPLLNEIRRLNANTSFVECFGTNFSERFPFVVRKEAVDFDYRSAFLGFVISNSDALAIAVRRYSENVELYKRYLSNVEKIKKAYSVAKQSGTFSYVEKYSASENAHFQDLIISKRFDEPSVTIKVFYRSPQGRSVYENYEKFGLKDIVTILRGNCRIRIEDPVLPPDDFVVDFKPYEICEPDEAAGIKKAEQETKENLKDAKIIPEPSKEKEQANVAATLSTTNSVKIETIKNPEKFVSSASDAAPKAPSTSPEQYGDIFKKSSPDFPKKEETSKDSVIPEKIVANPPVQASKTTEITKEVVQMDSSEEEKTTNPDKPIAKPIIRTVVSGKTGKFVTENDGSIFYVDSAGQNQPLDAVSYFDRHPLDEALLRTLLRFYVSNSNLPLSFSKLYGEVQREFGAKAISEEYLSNLLHPENPYLTKNHILSCWPDPKTFPGELSDAVTQFSLDEEEKICRFLSLLVSDNGRSNAAILLFLRFFLSYSQTLEFSDLSDVLFVPIPAIADYMLSTVKKAGNSAQVFIKFFLSEQAQISFLQNDDADSQNAILDNASDEVTSFIDSLDSSLKFFTVASGKTLLVNAFFLQEISIESAGLNKIILGFLESVENKYGQTADPLFYQKMLSLRMPNFPFDFGLYYLREAIKKSPISFSEPFLPLKVSSDAFVASDAGSPKTFYSLLALNHYKLKSSDGYAIKTKYVNLADAIYRGDITPTKKEEYLYNNPDQLKKYDDAIKELIDDFLIFYDHPGVYKTRFFYEKTGVVSSDFDLFMRTLKSYLNKNPIFSLQSIRKQFFDNPISSLIQDDEFLLRFVGAACHYSRLSLEKNSDEDYLFYTISFDDFLARLFKNAMNGVPSMTIYDIRDTVFSQYGVTYDLDQIGKDAVKAGMYYSDDFEKVYKKKTDYFLEVYSHK